MAEAVVLLAVLVDDHAAGDEFAVGIGLEDLGERCPAFRGVADAVVGDDFGRQTALGGVGLGGGGKRQLLRVKGGGGLYGAFQRLLLLLAGGAFGGVFRPRVAVVWHAHAYAVGKLLHSFGEGEPLVFHDEADGGAVCAAAEAVVKLFAGADGEAGGFFFVKRAARHVVCAAFFERDVVVDDVYDVGFGEQVVDKAGWNHGDGILLG